MNLTSRCEIDINWIVSSGKKLKEILIQRNKIEEKKHPRKNKMMEKNLKFHKDGERVFRIVKNNKNAYITIFTVVWNLSNGEERLIEIEMD